MEHSAATWLQGLLHRQWIEEGVASGVSQPAASSAPPAASGAVQPAALVDVFTLGQANVFTHQCAATLRRTTQGVHKQMRELLTYIREANPQRPVTENPEEPQRVRLPALTPWRIYLAHHKHSEFLIGPGVLWVYAQFRTRTDANRSDQLRLDFVVERADGSIVTFHPGRVPRGDAKLHLYAPDEFRP